MSKFTGRLVDVGIGKESSRGVVAAPAILQPKVSMSFDAKVNKIRNQASYGVMAGDGNFAAVAQKWGEGSLEFEMTDKSLGYFLLSLFGTLSTAGPSDSAYTHTFTVDNTASHDTLTIVVKDSDLTTRAFPLALVNNFTIEVTPDSLVKVTAEFMSKTEKDYGGTLPAYVAQNKWAGRNCVVKLATLTSGLAAASDITPRKLTLNFTKNVRPDFVLGTAEPVDMNNQVFTIDGEIELNYEDETYKDLGITELYRAMRIDFNDTDTLIGATSTPRFYIDLSRVYFEAWEPSRANDEIASQVIAFRALYDTTNGDVVNACKLINAQTSY